MTTDRAEGFLGNTRTRTPRRKVNPDLLELRNQPAARDPCFRQVFGKFLAELPVASIWCPAPGLTAVPKRLGPPRLGPPRETGVPSFAWANWLKRCLWFVRAFWFAELLESSRIFSLWRVAGGFQLCSRLLAGRSCLVTDMSLFASSGFRGAWFYQMASPHSGPKALC